MSKAEPLINPHDYYSIHLHIHFRNSITGTKIDPKKISLVEIGDKCLILNLPHASCVKFQNVILDLFVEEPGKKLREVLSVTGKIIELEDFERKSFRATIDCIQFEESKWNELLAIYSRRQEAINDFLKAAKGF